MYGRSRRSPASCFLTDSNRCQQGCSGSNIINGHPPRLQRLWTSHCRPCGQLIAPGTHVVWSRAGRSTSSVGGARLGGAPVTQQIPSTEPDLAGVRNFRDVGGLPTADGRRVRYGVLFRSGHLAHATEEDAAFLTSLGLHTIFDFRNAADQKLEGPDVELPGVRNVTLPLPDPADGAEFWKMVRDGEIEQLRGILGDGRAAGRM